MFLRNCTLGVSIFASSCLFLCGFLEAKVEDHFKKVLNRSEGHRMEGIDFIYMINLDQRPEKFQKCLDQLEPYGINPFRFSAVNGWELSLEDINDVGLKFSNGMKGGFLGTSYLPEGEFISHHEIIKTEGRTYFCHCIARGTIGIVLSHLSVLQDAYDAGYNTIWVMEDDIEVLKDPHLISDYILQLDKKVGAKGWDVLFTDQDIRDVNGNHVPCYGVGKRPNFTPINAKKYSGNVVFDADFFRTGSRFGAHSMILRRSGMKKILDFIKTYKVFLPYDMDYYLPPGIRMFSLREDVVSNQLKAISDNGGPNYLNK